MFLNNSLYTDALVNSTESFENHEAGVLDKVVQHSNEEEIIEEDVLALAQLLLCRVEIKVNVKVFDELCNGISICVRFLKRKIE